MAVAAAIAAAVASVAATAIGTSVGIAGAAEQNKQAQANAEAQEAQANYNKRLEEREAARIEAETAENARRQREEAERFKAQQRALLGASGAAMDSGTPLAILGRTAADTEMSIMDTHTGGAQQANQHREQAKMYQYQAGVARMNRPSGSSLGLNVAGQIGSGLGNLAQTGMGLAKFYRR